MMLEALLISLTISISFFLYEFFKIRTIFEDTFRYNKFFSGFGPSKFRLFDTLEKKESDINTKFSSMESKFYGIEDRLSKQEGVIEKLIRQMSGVNG